MKRIMLLASVAAIAACSPAEEPVVEEVDTVAEPQTAAVAQAMAADGQPAAGRYKITQEDGTILYEDLQEDGTYTTTNEAGEVVETGVYEQKSPSEYCYTVNEEGASQVCSVEGVEGQRLEGKRSLNRHGLSPQEARGLPVEVAVAG